MPTTETVRSVLAVALEESADRPLAHGADCEGVFWVGEPCASMSRADRFAALDAERCDCWVRRAREALAATAFEPDLSVPLASLRGALRAT